MGKIRIMLAVSAFISSSSAYVPASAVAPTRAAHTVRQSAVFMDETLMEKALAGELEDEGAENVFMSEVGWATYLDQNAESSALSRGQSGPRSPPPSSPSATTPRATVRGRKATMR